MTLWSRHCPVRDMVPICTRRWSGFGMRALECARRFKDLPVFEDHLAWFSFYPKSIFARCIFLSDIFLLEKYSSAISWSGAVKIGIRQNGIKKFPLLHKLLISPFLVLQRILTHLTSVDIGWKMIHLFAPQVVFGMRWVPFSVPFYVNTFQEHNELLKSHWQTDLL